MATVTISGKVVYAAAPWASEVPAAGVTVKIRDADFADEADVIFTGVTDTEGNFDGESSRWDDQPFDTLAMQVRVSERQYGTVTSPWFAYQQPPGGRAKVVLPWGPPNVKNFGEILVVAGRNAIGDLIYGSDETDVWDYRNRLMTLLYGMPPGSTPVFRGSHHFWICIPTPPLGFGSEHRVMDTLPQLPWSHPSGGFVHMNAIPDITDPVDIDGKVGTVLHETGHHWLVPSDVEFDDDGTRIRMLTEEECWQAVNDDAPFGGATMLGRDNSHWTPFWHAERSVMDGVAFARGSVDGEARWVGTELPGDPVHVDGLPDFTLRTRYNHLEQVIMGMREKDDAYPESGGRIRWIEPRLTAPLPYFAGLFVALANDDYIEFGYLNDHRTIAVVRNGEVLASVDSGDELQRAGVELHIDRVAGQYRFSIGAEPAGGCAAALLDWLIRAMGGIPFVPAPRAPHVLVLDEPREAVAAGALARTEEGKEIALEAAFGGLTLTGDGEITAGPNLPVHDGALDTLPERQWRRHVPAGGPLFRSRDGEERLLLPRYLLNGDGSLADQRGFGRAGGGERFTDRVPKIAIRPGGAFGLSARVRIHRSTISPRSGDRMRGLTVWGREKSAPVAGIKLSQAVRDRQASLPGDTYKVAYIIVARDFADVSEELVARVDGLRRAADASYEVATDGRRHLDSSLD